MRALLSWQCCSMLCNITYPAPPSPCLPINKSQCGTIHMALGSFAESIAQFEAALEIAPTQPAALLGAAESLAASAGMHSRQGALGALLCPSIMPSAAEPVLLHGTHVLNCPCCGVFPSMPVGAAADELARAAGYILRCTEKHGTLQAGGGLQPGPCFKAHAHCELLVGTCF